MYDEEYEERIEFRDEAKECEEKDLNDCGCDYVCLKCLGMSGRDFY